MITPLPDYYEKPVTIELPDLPLDYTLESVSYILETGYRTGTALLVNGERFLYGKGRLISADGVALKLRVFSLVNSKGETTAVSFTDEEGYFYLYDIIPDKYIIDLSDSNEVR